MDKLFIEDDDALNHVVGAYQIDDIETFDHFAETSVHAVEMLRILTVVADKELTAASVLASMGHREDTTIVVLLGGVGLALDGPSRTARTHTGVAYIAAVRTAALNDKVGDDTMETETVVETVLGKFNEIGDGAGNLFFIKLHFHASSIGVDDCVHIVRRFND